MIEPRDASTSHGGTISEELKAEVEPTSDNKLLEKESQEEQKHDHIDEQQSLTPLKQGEIDIKVNEATTPGQSTDISMEDNVKDEENERMEIDNSSGSADNLNPPDQPIIDSQPNQIVGETEIKKEDLNVPDNLTLNEEENQTKQSKISETMLEKEANLPGKPFIEGSSNETVEETEIKKECLNISENATMNEEVNETKISKLSETGLEKDEKVGSPEKKPRIEENMKNVSNTVHLVILFPLIRLIRIAPLKLLFL